jgi:peptide/nickel transport system permease protein
MAAIRASSWAPTTRAATSIRRSSTACASRSIVGGLGCLLAAVIGITLGLLAGYLGGRTDAIIMRIADVQLTFPAILIALLIDGVVRGIFKNASREDTAIYVLVVSIGLSFWVQYARTIRGSTLIERNKDYVMAARLVGLPAPLIMLRHVLPNVIGPVLVILTINLGLAVITEATLSFLGVGLPPTQPSLGTLISIGNKYLFSGDWWIVAFPGVTLAALVLAVNLLGDWLRDALNPRLR